MKKTLIIFLLLAVASLGLALPQSKVPLTPTPTPTPVPAPGSAPAAISPDSIDAALGGDLSKECTAAIFSIVTSPDFLKCIPVSAFVPLLPILTDPDFLKKLLADPAGTFKELEPKLVQFSTDFCVAPKCTNKGVSKTIKTLSEGCKAEIVSNPLIKLVFSATVFYSPLHDTVCFKSDKGKKFCWDESLTTIFSLPKSPIKIIDGGLLDSIAVSDPFAMCTKCNKDIVNTYGNFLKDNKLALQILANFGIDQKRLDLINVGIAVKCGIKFEDGTIP